MAEPGENAKLVLIIDDDEGVRELLGFLVKKEGFRVESAVDGEDGVQKAERLKPHLILLDLMMPRYGGFEVLRQLQGSDLSRIPIVIITGRYTDRSTAEMIRQESNVVDFLEKPVKAAVLSATLARLLKPRSSEAA
ncbi:MAG: response regulator [Elusimicrobia bacterium]|nr:response regulator [Elusimicrobiota bacterium]